ncbi:protein-glutamate O-methyltransferase CheR [Candidatus Sumerlaeota bacterium]|nr:protein-glutamate O-methyltransferase CheR [Candidatus Sumerlaeota bacterium]
MDPRTFNQYRKLIYEKSGISLSSGKEALLTSRLGKRMRALGISSHRDYLKYIANSQDGDEIVRLLDAISTNVTSFFREDHHFRFMQNALAQWNAKGQRRFRIWSAACSTGEEPYTLAMVLLDSFNGASGSLDAKILATDISTRVLQSSKTGVYAEEKVKTVPPKMRLAYFDKMRNGTEKQYAIKPALKKLIQFKRLNLSQPPFPMRGPFDLVFCRNVMIYFDQPVRRGLLLEIHRLLSPNGYLMVGHAESLIGMGKEYKSVAPSIYMKI